MNKIDVFFKLLENAKNKDRKVSFSDYSEDCISIFGNKSEGKKWIAEIRKGFYEKINLRLLFSSGTIIEKQENLFGWFKDTETGTRYKFCMYPTEEQYEQYERKFTTAVEEIKNEEAEKKEKEYQKFLEREVNNN